jgi:hypothetical protein
MSQYFLKNIELILWGIIQRSNLNTTLNYSENIQYNNEYALVGKCDILCSVVAFRRVCIYQQ